MRDPEEGAALPLIIGLFTIAVGFVLVAAAATSLHLERLRLLTVADGAALAGAESFRVGDVAVQGDRVVPALSSSSVRSAVDGYLDGADPGGLDALAVADARTTDGRSATVELRAVWHPPILSPLLPDGLPVTVSSTAAARFR